MEQAMRNERVPKFYSCTWQWLESPSLAQSSFHRRVAFVWQQIVQTRWLWQHTACEKTFGQLLQQTDTQTQTDAAKDSTFLPSIAGTLLMAVCDIVASEVLGRAVVTMDEVRRLPSSRQIIPLTSADRHGIGSMTSGSVTVEVRNNTLWYDTIRDAILTFARKPTWVSLIHRTETTTKKCKTEKN